MKIAILYSERRESSKANYEKLIRELEQEMSVAIKVKLNG